MKNWMEFNFLRFRYLFSLLNHSFDFVRRERVNLMNDFIFGSMDVMFPQWTQQRLRPSINNVDCWTFFKLIILLSFEHVPVVKISKHKLIRHVIIIVLIVTIITSIILIIININQWNGRAMHLPELACQRQPRPEAAIVSLWDVHNTADRVSLLITTDSP